MSRAAPMPAHAEKQPKRARSARLRPTENARRPLAPPHDPDDPGAAAVHPAFDDSGPAESVLMIHLGERRLGGVPD